ncbi:MAG TPA: NAD(P)/FAD-dependent oxidoreductase [Steroidobacteraceae bacterium]|nr:NAD(P)/FAD-dependent oxidoreductase [Steroidobacteraceae bacterium]
MEPDLYLAQDADRAHVLVMGGGPGGSTTAALLARKGLRVTLVEKDRHPRFHIGESLLPMNMPIFERLGLLDQVLEMGTRKLGADFPAANDCGYSVFRFDRTLNPGTGYAVQLQRAELDLLLFNHAAACGAETLQQTEVLAVQLAGNTAKARLRGPDGVESDLVADYVVDATGRSTLLGSALRLKRKYAQHQSAALFAHFAGVERRPGEDAGNISIYRFPSGWVWVIPLPGDCTSVGVVCYPEYLKERRGNNAEFLWATLQRIPGARERMRGARMIGHLHATGNYSYQCTRMAGPRWIMVGDAFAFLDPIFSSGVYLAMNSAERAAEMVAGALREPRREAALQRRYARFVRRGLDRMSWFVFRFTSPAMARLFSHPRDTLQVEQAMISMLAGDVFDSPRVWWRLQLFKLIYLGTWLSLWRRSWRNLRNRRRQSGMTFEGEDLV